MLKTIQTEDAPAAIGPYAQGIQAGNLAFISGQLGLDPATGELAGADLASQAHRALHNMKAVLTAAGCQLTDVAAVDVYLIDMDDFIDFNGIYETFFGEHKPARAVVAVKALPKAGRIEIKCTAYRPTA